MLDDDALSDSEVRDIIRELVTDSIAEVLATGYQGLPAL
jgi:hypothetical protein